jgi:cobalamin synthase
MLIPAGVLLGLGIGLLAGYPGPGVLIGLGLGFIGSAALAMQRSAPSGTEGMTAPSPRPRIGLFLIGAVLILVGISLVWAPYRWPVIAALFLILLGAWFLFRAFIHR